MDEKAPSSFFVSSQSPGCLPFIPCAERTRPLFVVYHTKKTARRAAPLCARACTIIGATFDVSFRVHSSSSLPSRGCEYPSMSSFRVRVQRVRRTRTRSRDRVHRVCRTRTRQLKLGCCPGTGTGTWLAPPSNIVREARRKYTSWRLHTGSSNMSTDTSRSMMTPNYACTTVPYRTCNTR